MDKDGEDRRRHIAGEALEEVGRAGIEDLFGFLTPERLADASRSQRRTWSAGTVRYHFRRQGLGFDRSALLSAVAERAVEEVRARLAAWADACESALAAAPEGDAAAALRAALADLPAVFLGGEATPSATGGARVLFVIAALGGREAAPAAPAVDAVRGSVARVLEAYARAADGTPPPTWLTEWLALPLGLGLIAAGIRGADVAGEAARSTEIAGRLLRAGRAGLLPPDGTVAAETSDDAVLRLERRLEQVDPGSPEVAGLVEELGAYAASSAWAFTRVRRRMESILSDPGFVSAPGGERVVAVAQEIVGTASGDRGLADEAASATLALRPLRADAVSLGAAIRTAWLLQRLERFDEAADHLERVGRLARREGLEAVAALADAFAARGEAFTGPVATAAARAESVRVPEDPSGLWPLALTVGAAGHARAFLALGDVATADAVVRAAERLPGPTSLGTTLLALVRGWIQLARGEDRSALSTLTRVRDTLGRLGVANPAGWTWLEPTVAALVRLDRIDAAAEAIAVAAPDARRWGTPLVLAEVARAESLVAAGPRERLAALGRARTLLADSPALVELRRTDLALARAGGPPPLDLPRDPGVDPSSPLVAVLAPGPDPLAQMTPRVREVALLVAAGRRNAEIAAELGLSPATVSRHVSAAMRATGTDNRTGLAAVLAGRRSA